MFVPPVGCGTVAQWSPYGGTAWLSPDSRSALLTRVRGAPRDELLHLFGLDSDGRIALFVVFDIEDLDAAIAELDAVHARFESETPKARFENTAARVFDTSGRTTRRTTGMPLLKSGRQLCRHRSPTGRECRDPTWSR